MTHALTPPEATLRACVVVPARDEADLVAGCLEALAGQAGVAPRAYEVLLVLDRCRDDTAARAAAVAARRPLLRLRLLEGPGEGAGAARRLGMDLACARLLAIGRADGLIASTDADSRVAPDWLANQLAAVARGARAIGGRVELSGEGARRLPPGALRRRRALAEARHARVRADACPERGDRAEHWQFSGASMAVTAATYREVGGLEPRAALEDEALERALGAAGVPIERLLAVSAVTSARLDGRAPRGLARDLRLATWIERNSFRAEAFPLDRLLAAKAGPISVVLPARDVADTVGPLVRALRPLVDSGLVDELLVVDGASVDGTPVRAAQAGATVVRESDLMAEHGPARGKGDAMWRAVAATSGDVVVFLDADTAEPSARYALGLLGPLLTEPRLQLVKGAFRRPFLAGGTTLADEGGRVTELVARPLLNLLAPDLMGFHQPLAGEIAARRGLLERLAFPVGYGVEIAMLIDALAAVGASALAQVDLGTRQNRHQPLHDLGVMAYEVTVAALRRCLGEDAVAAFAPGPLVQFRAGELEVRRPRLEERPPLCSLDPAGAATATSAAPAPPWATSPRVRRGAPRAGRPRDRPRA